jgi:hypothetical protein
MFGFLGKLAERSGRTAPLNLQEAVTDDRFAVALVQVAGRGLHEPCYSSRRLSAAAGGHHHCGNQKQQHERHGSPEGSLSCAPRDDIEDYGDRCVDRCHPGKHRHDSSRESLQRTFSGSSEDGASHHDREHARHCCDEPSRGGECTARPAPCVYSPHGAPKTSAAWKAATMKKMAAANHAATRIAIPRLY